MSNKIWHHHPYHFWSLAPQTLCERVWPVIKFFGKFLHPLTKFVAHLMTVSEGTRYGCNAYSKLCRQIF